MADGSAGELAHQYIYFAGLDQLNDPMEGYTDIFWRGDEVVWANLFKHYLLCCSLAYMELGMLGESTPIDRDTLRIDDPYSFHELDGMVGYTKELIARFLSDEIIQSYISKLAMRTVPVRQNELLSYLQLIHIVVMPLINRTFHERERATTEQFFNFDQVVIDALRDSAKQIDSAEELVAEHDGDESVLDAVFAAKVNAAEQCRLISYYDNKFDTNKKNKLFVSLDFPGFYMSRLETLVHPDWYVACFMSDCSDSSVWGSYGAAHAGVCLKFKTSQINGRATLALRTQSSWNSAGAKYSEVSHPLYLVSYRSQYPSVDFFRSLGSLSNRTVAKHWYSDGSGRESAIAKDGFHYDDQWRSGYLSDLFQVFTTKTEAWAYEKEQRIVLHSDLVDYSSTEERMLKYDFNTLDGIIFGVKTTVEDKLALFKAVERKCKELGRTEFKFYQAYYSHQKSCIAYAELTLLKFAR